MLNKDWNVLDDAPKLSLIDISRTITFSARRNRFAGIGHHKTYTSARNTHFLA